MDAVALANNKHQLDGSAVVAPLVNQVFAKSLFLIKSNYHQKEQSI
jgi:hypothetical protein